MGRLLQHAFLFVAVATIILSFETQAMSDCKPFVVDLYMGEPLPMEMVMEDLASVKIVYVGEVHTVDRHHKIQAEILRRLSDKGLKLALGMEMFSVAKQDILDRWQKGNDSVADLINKLGKVHWTNLMDYEPVLLLARRLDIPIIGLNAEDKLVRKVARKGLSSLTSAEKEQIPRGLKRINPLNDRLLRLKLQVHRAFKGKGLDRIVLAQVLRDATMARTIVRFLKSAAGRDRTMMVIAGTGHLNFGLGIPDRVQRQAKLSSRIILPSESGEMVLSEDQKRHSAPLEITHKDLRFINRPIADYLHTIPLKNQLEEPAHETPEIDEARLR
jgi:uncharacterized iron-regulated protein